MACLIVFHHEGLAQNNPTPTLKRHWRRSFASPLFHCEFWLLLYFFSPSARVSKFYLHSSQEFGLFAHLSVCLFACLPLTTSLASNMWSIIGICRSDHHLIQRGELAGCLGTGFRDMAGNQVCHICAVCHSGLICQRAVGVVFNKRMTFSIYLHQPHWALHAWE